MGGRGAAAEEGVDLVEEEDGAVALGLAEGAGDALLGLADELVLEVACAEGDDLAAELLAEPADELGLAASGRAGEEDVEAGRVAVGVAVALVVLGEAAEVFAGSGEEVAEGHIAPDGEAVEDVAGGDSLRRGAGAELDAQEAGVAFQEAPGEDDGGLAALVDADAGGGEVLADAGDAAGGDGKALGEVAEVPVGEDAVEMEAGDGVAPDGDAFAGAEGLELDGVVEAAEVGVGELVGGEVAEPDADAAAVVEGAVEAVGADGAEQGVGLVDDEEVAGGVALLLGDGECAEAERGLDAV